MWRCSSGTRISWPSSWGTLTPHSLLGPGPPPVLEGPWGSSRGFCFCFLSPWTFFMLISRQCHCHWLLRVGNKPSSDQLSYQDHVKTPSSATYRKYRRRVLMFFALFQVHLVFVFFCFLPKDHVNIREVKVQQYLTCFKLLYVTSSLWVLGANTSCWSIPMDPFQAHSQGL